MASCPICRQNADPANVPRGGDSNRWKCVGCGKFEIARTAISVVESLAPEEAARIRVSLWDRQRAEKWPSVDTKWVKNVLKHSKLLSPAEQADRLLLWIADGLGHDYGEGLHMREEKAGAIIGAVSLASTRHVQNHLQEEGFVHIQSHKRDSYRVRMRGWDRVEVLRRGAFVMRRSAVQLRPWAL